MKKKTKSGNTLTGRVVTLTEASEAHHTQMKEWDQTTTTIPVGCKLLGVEGEVTDAWRDDGQWVQVLVRGGDHDGELISMGVEQVKVVRPSVDPLSEKRDALLAASASIFAGLLVLNRNTGAVPERVMHEAVRFASDLDSVLEG